MNYILIIFCLIFSTACVSKSDSNKTNTPTVNSNEVSPNKNPPVELIENDSDKSDYTSVIILYGILLGVFVILYRQNKFISEIRELRDQQKLALATTETKPQTKSTLTAESSVESVKKETLDELSKSLAQAMNEISKRDATINNLTANVTRSNIQNNLVRLTQTLDIACLIQTRLANGKSNANESIEFIIDDIKSALNGQGVEFSEIKPGTRVADLPAGSFAAISVVDAPNESLKGTVKEVRSLCYFVSEENKKPRYIAAAKVILYRA